MKQRLPRPQRAFLNAADDSDVDQFLGYLVPHGYFEEMGYHEIAQDVEGRLEGRISDKRLEALVEGAPATDAEKVVLRKAYLDWFPGSGCERHSAWFFGEVEDEGGRTWLIARETAGAFLSGNETTNRLLFTSYSDMKSFFDMHGRFSGAPADDE